MKSRSCGDKDGNRKDNLEDILEDLEDLEDPEKADQAGAESQNGNGGPDQAEAEAEEELQVKYLRLAADFQNYRRRVDKEKNDIYSYANEKIMTELLAVIDNFDRALAIETADTGMKEGMAMILKQLLDVLEKSGLAEIPALEEEFDPNFHHAVQTVASKDHKGGQITNVLQKGYSLNNKVIRPSMVIVAE